MFGWLYFWASSRAVRPCLSLAALLAPHSSKAMKASDFPYTAALRRGGMLKNPHAFTSTPWAPKDLILEASLFKIALTSWMLGAVIEFNNQKVVFNKENLGSLD